MDNSAELLSFLAKLGIPYRLHHHQPMETIAQCQQIPGVDWQEAAMPKNVFLCNRQQTAHYLLLMRHDLSFRTAVVSKLLGVSRLSFAPEEHLPAMLGLTAGAVSPLGLLFDKAHQVQLVVDDALLGYRQLLFHPCVNHQSVQMQTRDFLDVFLPATQHSAQLISMKEQAAP